MTQDTNQATLHTWWTEQDFPGKEQYDLKDDGSLVLRGANGAQERTVASLTSSLGDTTLKALTEKFADVSAKVQEVGAEWDAAEDKSKLYGKVARLKEYLNHASAVGDMAALQQQVAAWDQELHTLDKAQYESRKQLAEQAESWMQSETWKETTQAFKDLTEQWKQGGHLDKRRSDELWGRIEHAKNTFFERKRQHHEEQEHDMLQNLDVKLELVEKAEKAAASEDWKATTELFKQLMDTWKQTGRTMHDKNEELWNRFITAKNAFYDRKRVHFEQIQGEQETNYTAKVALAEQAEALKDNTDWGTTAKKYTELMEQWKQIGRVPQEKSDEVWNRFTAAKEHFFNAKRGHNETYKVTLDDNYARKMALLKRAEELQASTHWREATEEMNELMTEWKQVGPVPRKHSDAIWEQFIAARKGFFDRKDTDRSRRKQHAEKQAGSRMSQTRQFLHRLQEELQEEKDKLADFSEGIENITPGHKEKELRAHLEKLIAQSTTNIQHKEEKIAEVSSQLQELEQKTHKDKPEEDKPEQE